MATVHTHPSSPPALRRRRGGKLAERSYLFGIVAAIALLAAAVAMPVVCLIVLSFQNRLSLFSGPATFANYSSLFSDSATRTALFNTVLFTAGGTFVAVSLGTAMAFAVTSVRIPGRSLLRVIPILVIILPPLVKDPDCVMLFSPKTGLINVWFHDLTGINHPLFNVFTLYGMIIVVGVFAAPYAYVIMLTPMESIDQSLIDASRMSGAPLRRTLFRVVLPMIRPALLSAVTLLVIVIAASFETPVIIGTSAGISTFMSQLYEVVHEPVSGLNYAAAQGSVYVVLTGVMVVLYLMATRNERRFVAISGRGHSHQLLEGRWLRWGLAVFMVLYGIIAFLAPLVMTVLVALVPYYSALDGNPFKTLTLKNFRQVFDSPNVYSGIKFSALLALVVAVGVVVVAGSLALIALKSKSRYRRVCEAIAMAPVAVPAPVYSVGLLLTVLSIPPLTHVAYGTTWLMGIAEVIVFLPLAMRVLSSALIQVQDELIEASTMSGARRFRTICTILVPILRPAMLYTASVVFVLSYRELGAIIFLVPANTSVVSNVSFGFFEAGGYPALSALNVVALVVPLVLVCVFVGLAQLGTRLPHRRRWQAIAVQPTVVAERI